MVMDPSTHSMLALSHSEEVITTNGCNEFAGSLHCYSVGWLVVKCSSIIMSHPPKAKLPEFQTGKLWRLRFRRRGREGREKDTESGTFGFFPIRTFSDWLVALFLLVLVWVAFPPNCSRGVSLRHSWIHALSRRILNQQSPTVNSLLDHNHHRCLKLTCRKSGI